MGKRKALSIGGLFAIMTTLASAQGPETIGLVVTGAADTRFTGECVVVGDAGEQVVPIEGVVPLERQLLGHAIRCTIRQTTDHGRLEVELSKGGNLSRSRTGGRGSTVTLQMR